MKKIVSAFAISLLEALERIRIDASTGNGERGFLNVQYEALIGRGRNRLKLHYN